MVSMAEDWAQQEQGPTGWRTGISREEDVRSVGQYAGVSRAEGKPSRVKNMGASRAEN